MSQPESSQPAPSHPESSRRLSGWAVVLLVVIIGGAFALSADSWVGLAVVAGFSAQLAWLFPVAIDGYLILATYLWLTSRRGSDLRRWSAGSLVAVVLLSVSAQAVHHGMSAGVSESWALPLVLVLGGLPPLMLATAVHLLSLAMNQPAPEPAARPSRGKRTGSKPRVEVPDSPAALVSDAPEAPLSQLHLVPAPRKRRESPAAKVPDSDIADAIREYVLSQRAAGSEPVQREMVRLVRESTGESVGQRRCVNIAARITEEEQVA